MIPKIMADNWIEQQGYYNAQAVNLGGCENFAQEFLPLFEKAELVGTDNFVDWDNGKWPGGHCWIFSKGKHYDSEALEGVCSWKELPFFKRGLREMRTVTWMSKNWIERITKPSVIISIGDPQEDLPNFAVSHIDVLRLEFHDIPNGISIDDLDSTYREMDWHDARKLLQFEHRYKDDDIIVHCHAGVSRSAAVALYIGSCCKRVIDLAKPCSGDYSLYNRQVYRQLELAHCDLQLTGAQVTQMDMLKTIKPRT